MVNDEVLADSMRVLMLSPKDGVVGGISIWTRNILTYCDSQHKVQIELFDFSRTRTGQMINNKLKRMFLAACDYFRLTSKAVKEVRQFDGEVIHLCSSASYLLIRDYIVLRCMKRRQKTKTCIHFHFGRIPELAKQRNWEWKLLKRVSKLADQVIVMDQLSCQTLRSNDLSNVALLPNPLSDSVLNMINAVEATREDRVVLFAGHCIPTKGIFELVQACKDISNIKLRLIGAISPEIKQKLVEVVGENPSWLEIKGQLSHEQTIQEMKSCDIFVLPTYTEGFPNVIIESMACGCPIVASAVGAIPEMLEMEDGNHYGQLIQPKDSEQIRTAIERYLNDDDFKKECATNVQRRVKERYNIQCVGLELVKIWEQLQIMR